MELEDNYLVYENWRAEKKAVVHKSNCAKAKKGHLKRTRQWMFNNFSANGRWFGYFETLESAINFGTLLPNRKLKLCGRCLGDEKTEINKKTSP